MTKILFIIIGISVLFLAYTQMGCIVPIVPLLSFWDTEIYCHPECYPDHDARESGGHTCAVVTGGAVRCWGRNDYGQLGYGHTNTLGDDENPASIGNVNVGGTVTQIAIGGFHTCALLMGGTVRCWGANQYGQLGYGHTDTIGDDEKPDSVANVDLGMGVTATQIATGGNHTCALLEATNTVRCWGANQYGQLGYGDTDTIGDDEKPDSVASVDLGLGVTATQIALGADHSCVLLTGGAVRCWGQNDHGQLGYGNTDTIGDDEKPDSVANVDLGMGVTATQIALGADHSCVLLTGGAVRCWGQNDHGQLGYGHTDTIGDDEKPASIGNVYVRGSVTQIVAGGGLTLIPSFGQTRLEVIGHTCALLDTGNVRCWGNNYYGQLGYGHEDYIGDDEIPASSGNINIGGSVRQIAIGKTHSCALLVGGTIRCWGANFSYGQLGYGHYLRIGNNESPASAGDVNVGAIVTGLWK